MVIKKLGNLENPRHNICPIKTRNIQFHAWTGLWRRRWGGGKRTFKGGDLMNKIIKFGVEGALIIGDSNLSLGKLATTS